MHLLHNNRIAGHLGREKTSKAVRSKFYWHETSNYVSCWCDTRSNNHINFALQASFPYLLKLVDI